MGFLNCVTVDVIGTSYQGSIDTTFGNLVEVFGDPTYVDYDHDAKINIEWELLFDDGTVATIYNYKDYDGGAEAASGCVYHWHIGGFSREAHWLVIDELEKHFDLVK